jgi:hypothetical protein
VSKNRDARPTRAAYGAICVTLTHSERSNSHAFKWIRVTLTCSIVYEHFVANPLILNTRADDNLAPVKIPPSNVLYIEARC